MTLTQEDVDRIGAAIRDAEQRSSAEIVCVLARRSSDYAYVPALWAAFLALVAPWLLVASTNLSVRAILCAQALVFIVAALVFSFPPLRFALVPAPVKRARAHRAALEQFFTRGVANTKSRAGVLIFVSLAERYARIVADEAVAAYIPQEGWSATLDRLCEDMRAGEVGSGFVAAIEECARLLAPYAPPVGRDELPNKIYLM